MYFGLQVDGPIKGGGDNRVRGGGAYKWAVNGMLLYSLNHSHPLFFSYCPFDHIPWKMSHRSEEKVPTLA